MFQPMVNYRLNAEDVEEINDIRRSASNPINPHTVGQLVPMIITVQNDYQSVNGTVFLDGAATMWKTSVHQGYQPGQYSIL